MDDWTKQHLSKWLTHQFTADVFTESDLFTVMIAKFEEDSEFWTSQSYWKLYDNVKGNPRGK